MKCYIMEEFIFMDGWFGAVYDYKIIGFSKPNKENILEVIKKEKGNERVVGLEEVESGVPDIYIVEYNERMERKVLWKFNKIYKSKDK